MGTLIESQYRALSEAAKNTVFFATASGRRGLDIIRPTTQTWSGYTVSMTKLLWEPPRIIEPGKVVVMTRPHPWDSLLIHFGETMADDEIGFQGPIWLGNFSPFQPEQMAAVQRFFRYNAASEREQVRACIIKQEIVFRPKEWSV